MNKITILVAGAIALSFAGSSVAAKPGQGGTTTPEEEFNGNGAPSGSHYGLNLIGMEYEKNAADGETKGSGHRIFVRLNGKTKILLRESLEQNKFEVIDYDGTDGEAMFALPAPDPECDDITAYSVYIRALTPHGSATMYSCGQATNDLGGQTWCSTTENVEVSLSKNGRETFSNVSRELLYVSIDTNGTEPGGKVRVPLFDDSGQGFWWEYDNVGLKLAQMRFYPIATDVSGDGYTCGKFPDTT